MNDDKNKKPSNQSNNERPIEKAQQSGQLNESKIPDFRFTPSPPPPPKESNSSSGEKG